MRAVKVPKSIIDLSQIIKELNSVTNQEVIRFIVINYAIVIIPIKTAIREMMSKFCIF